MVEFLRIPGLGPKTVRKIWQELGVSTLAELKDAARAKRLRTLPGLGAKLEENVLKSVGRRRKAEGPPQTLLGQALPALLAVVEVLREHPASDRVCEAGGPDDRIGLPAGARADDRYGDNGGAPIKADRRGSIRPLSAPGASGEPAVPN